MRPKPSKRKRIKVEARARERDAYHDLKRMYLREHHYCEAEICCGAEVERDGVLIWYPARATEIHHMRGRGRYYLDVSTWLAVCADCHRYITEHPAYAFEYGFSLRRNANDTRALPGHRDDPDDG